MRRRWMLGVAALALAGVAACDAAPEWATEPLNSREPAASPDVASTATVGFAGRVLSTQLDGVKPVEPTWTLAGNYATSTSVVDGVVVATRYGDPQVTQGIDATTGEVLWTRATSRGAVERADPAGARLVQTDQHGTAVLVTGPTAYYEVQDASLQVPLILDLHTGETLARLRPAWVRDSWTCHAGGGTCLRVAYPGDTHYTSMRIDPARLTLEPLADVQGLPYDDYTAYDGDVFAVVDDEGHALVKYVDGEEVWRTPTPASSKLRVLTSEGYIDTSTWWEHEDVVLISFGWVGGEVPALSAEGAHTFAVDSVTGEVLWERPATLMCYARVLCSEGVYYSPVGDSNEYTMGAGDMAVEGVDLRTGSTTWERVVEGAGGLSNSVHDRAYIRHDDEWIYESNGDPRALDVQTGVESPLGDRVTACARPVVVPLDAYSLPGEPVVDTTVGSVRYACTSPDDTRAELAFTREAVNRAAAHEYVTVDGELESVADGDGPRVRVVRTDVGMQGFTL